MTSTATTVSVAELYHLAVQHGTDKADHGYLPYYARHLRRQHIRSLLEVGVATGASLRMWRDWLPHAAIYGVDIGPIPATVADRRIATFECDVKALPVPAGWALDVVVDDGSHHAEDIVAGWRRLWPAVTAGGWYVIEDLFTQWQPSYGGGLLGSPVTSSLLPRLTGELLRDSGEVAAIHVYPKIVFLQKGR
jgi:demethylmacrocin O-methyltransferase